MTTQNAAGNKVDYYLKRSIDYQLAIDPSGDLQSSGSARVNGRLTITLTNGAPTSGHDISALGPYQTGFAAGENRLFVSMYTPLAVATGSLDGTRLPLQSGTELGQNVYSSYVDVLSGATRTMSFTVQGVVHLVRGQYTLELPRQPTLGADHVTIRLGVPSGWQVESGAGSWSRKAEITLDLNGPKTLFWRMRRNGPLAWLDPVASTTTPGSG